MVLQPALELFECLVSRATPSFDIDRLDLSVVDHLADCDRLLDLWGRREDGRLGHRLQRRALKARGDRGAVLNLILTISSGFELEARLECSTGNPGVFGLLRESRLWRGRRKGAYASGPCVA